MNHTEWKKTVDWDKMIDCPHCGKRAEDMWVNDIPLTVFCWGTPENEHPEHKQVIEIKDRSV